jgi:raffinose/stachyose/melibiose transport system substrate-binding protein
VNLVARRLRPALAVIALAVAACSNSTATPTPAATASPTPTPAVTATPSATATSGTVIRWWHTATKDPGKSIWETAARMFMSEHPGVTIDIETMDEATLAKRVAGVEQTGEVPDLLASSAGATLADMAGKGLLRDITSDVASWSSPAANDIDGMNLYAVAGTQYGAPWAMGATAFFYNKTLFTRVGIEPPATWTDFLTAVDKLKNAGIVPFAIAGRDQWPAMNLWSYLLLREAGSSVYRAMIANGDWDNDACAKASSDLAALVAKSPFQPGYLSAAYDAGEAAWMGNGQAAMELAGEWAPAAAQVNSKDGKGLGDQMGAFAFPMVDGGAGKLGDAIGSPSGFVVGKRAPALAVEFLHFLLSRTIEDEIGASGLGLPTVGNSVQTITDPGLRELVQARDQGRSVDLYLNLLTTPAMTKAVEDAVALLLAGRATPAQTCTSIAAAAKK